MYAVVTYYSFDTAIPIILFDTEEQAKEYLQQMFQSKVQADIESGKQPVTSHADDGWWAQVENDWTDAHGDTHEDITLWQITDDISDHRRNPRTEVKAPADEALPDPRQEKDVRFNNTTAYAMYDAMGCPLAAYVPKQFSSIDIAVFDMELLSDDDAAEIRGRLRELEESGEYVAASFWAPDAEDLKDNLGIEE